MAFSSYGDFPPYVSVAELRKQGHEPAPIVLAPRGAIASTFWGKAWCDHLESYADYATRLPRGRSYVRNGSVIDRQIGTVVELLSGKLSGAVMEQLCHRERGLFPSGKQLELRCSCPDGAWLCKHLAAVLYGVGARLDEAPEFLFTLRGVDGAELVAAAGQADGLAGAPGAGEGGLA